MKPGWQTTEFWLSILAPALSVGVMLGYLRPEDADSLQTLVGKLFTDLTMFWGVVQAVKHYNQGRARVKSSTTALPDSESASPTGPRLAA